MPARSVGLAGGVSVFAAVILSISGLTQVLQGIVALTDDEFFVVRGTYTYEFDVTSWGWIHVVVGAVALVAGLALLSGALWARATAITLAAVSILVNFAWLPYFPLWATVVISLDLLVIWAVTKFEAY